MLPPHPAQVFSLLGLGGTKTTLYSAVSTGVSKIVGTVLGLVCEYLCWGTVMCTILGLGFL